MSRPGMSRTWLDEELRALGDHIVTPEPPDVRAAVRARLAEPVPRWRRYRWLIALLAAAVAVLIAAAPPARAAIGRILHFAGIEISEPTTPSARPSVPGSPAALPTLTVGLAQARGMAGFPVGIPQRLGLPDTVQVLDVVAGRPRVVSLIWDPGTPREVRLDEFDGEVEPVYLKQLFGTPDLRQVTIGTTMGYWLSGPQVLTYVDRQGVARSAAARLAGPTLIWQLGAVAYRLEGIRDAATAIAVAASVS
jgi:hypothetical protein